jgi:hypothetical protein
LYRLSSIQVSIADEIFAGSDATWRIMLTNEVEGRNCTTADLDTYVST